MSALDLVGVVVTLTTAPSAAKTDPIYLNPAVLALAGTVFGGVGLKTLEKWLARGAEKREAGRDYRGEINELVDRMNKVEEEVGFWRNRFYEEQEHNHVLRIAMIQGGLTPPPLVARPPMTEAPTA